VFNGVQIEIVSLNGQSTMLMVTSLVDLVTMFYNDIAHLKDDNAALKQLVEDLHRLFDGPLS
jgi:hypothetical protein